MRFKNFHMHLKIQQETVRIFPTPIFFNIAAQTASALYHRKIILSSAF